MGNDWSAIAVILVVLEALTGISVIGMFVFAMLERRARRRRPYGDPSQTESGHERIETRMR